MISVTRKVRFVRRPNGSRKIVTAPAEPAPRERVPRIARLMALAIYFDRMIREGKIKDQTELARLVHVSQPRITQIMNLNHLAPDIQEELLTLRRATQRRDRVHERLVRPIANSLDWRLQRQMWKEVHSSNAR